MASQKCEGDDHDDKKKPLERNDKSESDLLQSQLVVASVLPPEYDVIELSTATTTTPSPSSVTTGSITTSVTSLNSASNSSSTSNLRDLENVVKLGSRPLSSVSNVSNNNSGGTVIPTTTTTSSSNDLRRTEFDPKDSAHLSIPKICPGVNCPEKVVLCLDLSSEMEQMKFLSRAGDRFSTLQLVKRTIGLFVQNKHRLDSRHEFALVTVHETAAWVCDFTHDPREISNLLEDLEETCDCSHLDMGYLLKVILRRTELPIMVDPALPPPFIVRMILILGRSQSKLDIDQEVHKLLLISPYLFIDVFYVHEPPSEDNCCEQIFDQLCSLDVKGQSYIFEVSKNLTKLYDSMAKLLAHSLQRPLQKDASHRIRANMEEV